MIINAAYVERQNIVEARGLAATQGELLRLMELLGIERGETGVDVVAPGSGT